MNVKSLRFRAIASFCILSIGLLAVYSYGIHGSASLTEDVIFNHMMKEEAASYFIRYQSDPDTPLPQMAHLKAFADLNSMPEDFRKTVQDLADGIYETSGPGSIPGVYGYNILIASYPGEEKRLYLFYNTEQKIHDNDDFMDIYDIQIIMFVITALFGLILFCIIGAIIFKPLRTLTKRVSMTNPGNIIPDIPETQREDEIGLLARNIENSFQRIEAFIERERQFTQSASHELRTPLSVIKGATDLIPIAMLGNTEAIDKLLDRIRRSTGNMEDTINTFLWLAREENLFRTGEECDVSHTIAKVVEDLSPILEQKQVKLNTRPGDEIHLSAPTQVVRIILSNILTNAITYTGTGTVNVLAKDNRVTIWDTGKGIPTEIIDEVTEPYVRGASGNGFGLGLSIVKSLCCRFGWKLSIRNRLSTGAVVTVHFETENSVK